MQQTDVAVIGGGPGGYGAALRAAQLGRNAIVIEKEGLGGVCLNWGCIPSKALLHAAEVLDTVREAADYGIKFDNLSWDFGRAVSRSRDIVAKQTRGLQYLMRKNGVEVIPGVARFTRPGQLEVRKQGGESALVSADDVVIAAGGRARQLPDLPADGVHVITSREALALTDLPAHALIVGGGAIGVEFACIWHSFGVKVTLVEFERSILPAEDAEVSTLLTRQLQGRGIRILADASVRSHDPEAGRAQVETADGREEVAADIVLVAVGMEPHTDQLGLAAAGVQSDSRGFVAVNEYMGTNVPHVYAVGDVTGKSPLAHVALAQAVTAAEKICGEQPQPLSEDSYRNMPRCIYGSPQVAALGRTEEELQAAQIRYNKGHVPLFPNGKAKAMGIQHGFIKILADAQYGEILGAHMIGPGVTELLPSISLAQMMELTSLEIARTVHAHPTLSEAVMDAAAAVEGQPLHQ